MLPCWHTDDSLLSSQVKIWSWATLLLQALHESVQAACTHWRKAWWSNNAAQMSLCKNDASLHLTVQTAFTAQLLVVPHGPERTAITTGFAFPAWMNSQQWLTFIPVGMEEASTENWSCSPMVHCKQCSAAGGQDEVSNEHWSWHSTATVLAVFPWSFMTSVHCWLRLAHPWGQAVVRLTPKSRCPSMGRALISAEFVNLCWQLLEGALSNRPTTTK